MNQLHVFSFDRHILSVESQLQISLLNAFLRRQGRPSHTQQTAFVPELRKIIPQLLSVVEALDDMAQPSFAASCQRREQLWARISNFRILEFEQDFRRGPIFSSIFQPNSL